MIVEPLHLNLDLVDPDAVQTVHKIITLTNSQPHKMAFKIRTTAREECEYEQSFPFWMPRFEIAMKIPKRRKAAICFLWPLRPEKRN
jgi:hypothetical protein